MTSILLPLVVSVASLGIHAPSFTPVDSSPSIKVSSEYLSSQDRRNAWTVTSAVREVIAGPAYPEEYRWTSSGRSAELGELGEPISRDRVVSGVSDFVEGLSNPDDSADEEFSWTNGVGLVGVGFRWQFR